MVRWVRILRPLRNQLGALRPELLEHRTMLDGDPFPFEVEISQPLPENAEVGDIAATIATPLHNQGLALLVYPDGRAALKNTNDTPLAFNGYQLDSEQNDLDPAHWKSISDYVAGGELQTIISQLGAGALSFGEASPASGNLAELNLGGSGVLQAHAEFAIGKPFQEFPPAFTFYYAVPSEPSSHAGPVVFVDGAVPPELTFTLIDSANGRFRLDDGLIVVDRAAFDYETEPWTTVRLEAHAPGGLTHQFDVHVPIGNVNEAPSISLQSSQPLIAVMGQPRGFEYLSVYDPDIVGPQGDVLPVLMTLHAQHGALEIPNASSFLQYLRSPDGRELTLLGPLNSAKTALAGLTYRSDNGFVGADEVVLTVNDLGQAGVGGPLTSSSTWTIQVQANPVAVPDRFYVTTSPDGTDLLSVLGNDLPLPDSTAVLVEGPRLGRLILEPNGYFKYWAPPDLGLRGPDSFHYKLSHPAGDSAIVEVVLYTLLGDVNGDRKVDLNDYAVLKQNFGRTPAQADFNGNGRHDLEDFGILKANFGRVEPTSAAAAASAPAASRSLRSIDLALAELEDDADLFVGSVVAPGFGAD